MARISDSVGLSDNHAILLEDSLRESRILREKVVERDEESILKFQELSSKVDRLCQILDQKQTERNSRNKKGSKIYVPTGCRTEFRRMYKSLMEDDASFQGFYLEESASSTRNKAAFAVVAEAVKNDHGGEEECPWSTAQLRAAFLTYLRSLKDTQKRRRVPGKVEHKIVCRRQGRLREKIARRISAINGMDWDDTKKERCCKFLTFDYTSSDESEISEDENGEDAKRFVTKRLAWESSKLRELKDLLDRSYRKSLNPHVRNFQTARVVGERFSVRGPPPDAPKWAVKSNYCPVATSTPIRAD